MKPSLHISLLLYAASVPAFAARKSFSINDDILAFPQFDVFFPEEYILDSEARIRIQKSRKYDPASNPPAVSADRHEVGYRSQQHLGDHGHTSDDTGHAILEKYDYEEMILNNKRYLCDIPIVEINGTNSMTEDEESAKKKAIEEEKELVRATDRGLELLQEMEGTCMYYVSGWWSYSFCYKKQVRQFHALAAGGGIPNYPPVEDPATHAYVLGRFHSDDEDDEMPAESTGTNREIEESPNGDITELQTKGESRYLVQRLGGGTICDLTGRERRIEVQFHCHPQTTDRIGWIKEITTCSYLMVIYTPRLCHDVAFQLPQPENVYPIECREILSSDEEVDNWKKMNAHKASQKLVNSGSPEFPVVGGIEVGAMKLVGTEGRRIEKGRVASAGEERVQVVAQRENGELQSLSRDELNKIGLDPEGIENFKDQLEELAKGKDWRLEVVEVYGERGLRGIVDTDEDQEFFDQTQDKASQKNRQNSPAKGKGQPAVNEKGKTREKVKSEEDISQPNNEKSAASKRKAGQEDEAGGDVGSEEIFHEEL